MRQIKGELVALGVDEEIIASEVQKYSQQKQIQEQMIVKKMQACLNFEI
jgi:SOS response regulatory protein OraA/RecX